MRSILHRYALFAIVLGLLAPARALADIDWNETHIHWMSFDDGLAAAKTSKKPICLILFAEWCPHCKNYSAVFHDPKVIAKAKRFIMIRADVDKTPELDQRFMPDGNYIPRTFFLTPEGEVRPVAAGNGQYKYFYDEHRSISLLHGMELALKKDR